MAQKYVAFYGLSGSLCYNTLLGAAKCTRTSYMTKI